MLCENIFNMLIQHSEIFDVEVYLYKEIEEFTNHIVTLTNFWLISMIAVKIRVILVTALILSNYVIPVFDPF